MTANPNRSGNTFSTGDTITSGTVYYFKVEPIKWRILEESNGKAIILCETIIDAHEYDDASNNYKESEIRSWLNDEFYTKAFSTLEQGLINAVTVDNSARSTNPDNNATAFNNGANQYACENTSDKVWLLSVQEVTRAAYGFNTSYSAYDTVRRKQTSDYSRANCAYIETSSNYFGNGWWWLRSPDCSDSGSARGVSYFGDANNHRSVKFANYGVVPALQITL